MTQVLVTKPGALNQRDKATLRKSGIVCVEAENPSDVKLIQTDGPEMNAGDMLFAAMSAIAADSYTGNVSHSFPKILAKLMVQRRAASE